MKLPHIEIIESVAPNPNLLLWKYPDTDREIKNGAKLTVRPSQQALFINEGQIADVFDAGLHTLKTENIPILSKLKGWKYGFESPFKADVYFFNTHRFIQNKWGTPAPILMQDKAFGQVRLRAFGTYDIRIADVKTFFSQYAGSFSHFNIFELQAQLRDFIAPIFGEVLAQEQISIKEVAGNMTHLSERVLLLLIPYFQKLGLELLDFRISSVTLPDEVSKHYDKITSMNMVNDIDKYTQFSAAQAMSQKGTAMSDIAASSMAIQAMNQGFPKTTTKETDIPAKLKQLKDLLDNGLIDSEDYQAKKKELLDQL
ncbi:SPFH domain-containing protein [Sphingobacterium corticis]|uniref:SPFH domain-containing protein n=1 Tax=Sphingobacterium corticis TaxID=1812823 RepID=A0ABW5NIQ6_9SPHI